MCIAGVFVCDSMAVGVCRYFFLMKCWTHFQLLTLELWGCRKVKAIRSIGGILKQSQRLLLLWDPTYVERCLDILDFGSGSRKERVSLGPKTLGQDLEHSL